ncbi:MAG: cytochrome c3 family protein, partial [Acidobacteria bacterium]|nr:cytochrome c3 family protein [Acidobacteriota bacterium]
MSVESTNCADCHGDLVENKTLIHGPAAEDCTTCHEMTLEEGGTRASLIEAEPPLCLVCHDELTSAVEAELKWPHFPVTDSCLGCHDPHGTVEAHLLKAPLQSLCGECHDLEDLAAPNGGQLTAVTDCVKCHQPHGGVHPSMLRSKNRHPPFEEGSCVSCHRDPFGDRVRLRNRGEKLCTACHGDVLEVVAGGSLHGAVQGERGRAGCLSCHDPHMSEERKLLVAGGGELCKTCHQEVVDLANAETGHPPAADDCLTCHEPHGSPEPHLLTMEPGEVCSTCHDTDDDDLRGAHLGADLSRLTCTQCHTPHGSGHEKLLAKNLHWPVTEGCETCHQGSFDNLSEGGSPDLCLLCHDDIGELASSATVPHAALELGTCTDCHNPHASAQQSLLKQAGGGVCLECHDEQAPSGGEIAHGIISLVGCQACHEPHGGERPRLLRRSGNELCL